MIWEQTHNARKKVKKQILQKLGKNEGKNNKIKKINQNDHIAVYKWVRNYHTKEKDLNFLTNPNVSVKS